MVGPDSMHLIGADAKRSLYMLIFGVHEEVAWVSF